jgi:tetratricopeptide (TPR) repeat protein
MLLQNQGKLDEAIESYKKALQIDPKFQKARDVLDAALAQKQAGR